MLTPFDMQHYTPFFMYTAVFVGVGGVCVILCVDCVIYFAVQLCDFARTLPRVASPADDHLFGAFFVVFVTRVCSAAE